MNLHCTFRAKFLTAETFDPFAPVNYRFLFNHGNCICGTDLFTLAAGDAAVEADLGADLR